MKIKHTHLVSPIKQRELSTHAKMLNEILPLQAIVLFR